MLIHFIHDLLNFLKIRSRCQAKETKGIYFLNKVFTLQNFAEYIAFKEFEGNSYKKNIEMLNDEDLELNYFLKYHFILFDTSLKIGGFQKNFCDKLKFYNLSYESTHRDDEREKQIHKSIIENIKKNIIF